MQGQSWFLSKRMLINLVSLTKLKVKERAVDGKTSSPSSCFHTKSAAINWWYVDLEQIYPISLIELYNRLDCCSNRARNITVLVGDSLNSLTQVAHYSGQIEDQQGVFLSSTVDGRYVKVIQKANDYFHLCEVKVWAYYPDENDGDYLLLITSSDSIDSLLLVTISFFNK
ncbi:fucolectin-5-like [Mercenaria mercenaria]|uniref:fucolectin-5-like n=1 Tax=Mercenaria mercenaria TaxID=6596 RepID=UPI00234F67E7|nr:fucolectin-5-like [Mercenaria mercenaria]